jgi:hypothetical protein
LAASRGTTSLSHTSANGSGRERQRRRGFCEGRVLLHADPHKIAVAFGLPEFSEIPSELRPRFNIAPSQRVPIVRNQPRRDLTIIRRAGEGTGRELVTMRWGLIPGQMMIRIPFTGFSNGWPAAPPPGAIVTNTVDGRCQPAEW